MNIFITGAWGTIGRRLIAELLRSGQDVTAFDRNNRRNRSISRKYGDKSVRESGGKLIKIWGDIRDTALLSESAKDADTVCHLAAVIPPAADRWPEKAYEVNVTGTERLLEALKKRSEPPLLIYTSSIAVYGDRRNRPLIGKTEQPCPNPEDSYARQKLRAEELIRTSGISWIIFRLSYIVARENLRFHPILFEMPLDTPLEICTAEDTAAALAHAVGAKELSGRILPIAGGCRCRTIYREYLRKMLGIFGFGKKELPEEAFSPDGFHCGYMETDECEQQLHFQKSSLGDLFRRLKKELKAKRFWISLLRPAAYRFLLNRSPYLKSCRTLR